VLFYKEGKCVAPAYITLEPVLFQHDLREERRYHQGNIPKVGQEEKIHIESPILSLNECVLVVFAEQLLPRILPISKSRQ
jgi:hypothetical protein